MQRYVLSLVLISLLFSTSVFAAETALSPRQESSLPTRKNYPTLPAPGGPYSIAVRHNNTLYLSGMTAFGTPAQGKGIIEQANAIFDQIKQITEAEGISMKNLIKVTIYVTSLDEMAALRQIFISRYEGSNPASTLVRIAELAAPGLSIEIEAIFALP